MGMLMHHSLMRSAGQEPDTREGEPIADSLSFEKPDLPQSGLYQAVGEEEKPRKAPAKKSNSNSKK